jgi:hypothetical protein
MQHSFRTLFTNEELASIVHNYCGNFTGQIDCVKFLYEFFKLRDDNNARLAEYQFYASDRLNEDERLFTEDVIEKMAYTAPIQMWPATQEEMQSAFVKLKNASSFVKPDIFGNLRKYFEASDLSPTMLQKFLIRNFDVELNGGELDATMRVFDLNEDGAISYGEFMTTFFQLGLEERSRRLLAQRSRDEVVSHAKKEKVRIRNDAFDNELRSHIVWPVLPDEDAANEGEEGTPSFPSLSPKSNRQSIQSSFRKTGTTSKSPSIQFPKITAETQVCLYRI